MKKSLFIPLCMVAAVPLALPAPALSAKEAKANGKALFERHCEACHADGGNTMNPAKTLKKKELEANGLSTPDDIIKVMRQPGPGMTAFNADSVSNKEARAIAEYVLKTFK